MTTPIVLRRTLGAAVVAVGVGLSTVGNVAAEPTTDDYRTPAAPYAQESAEDPSVLSPYRIEAGIFGDGWFGGPTGIPIIGGLAGLIPSTINILFGGSYGFGGNPLGSDQGTWWYQLGEQIGSWSQIYNPNGNQTCYDGNTPYPCGYACD